AHPPRDRRDPSGWPRDHRDRACLRLPRPHFVGPGGAKMRACVLHRARRYMTSMKRFSLLLAGALSSTSCIPKDAPGASPGGGAALGACPATATIEDAEDDNNQVLVQDGRGGYIYTFGDKAGSTIAPGEGAFTMTPGGAGGSQRAMHVSGKIGSA